MHEQWLKTIKNEFYTQKCIYDIVLCQNMHLMPLFYIPRLYAYECKGASKVDYVDYGAPHLIIVPKYMQMPLHLSSAKVSNCLLSNTNIAATATPHVAPTVMKIISYDTIQITCTSYIDTICTSIQ